MALEPRTISLDRDDQNPELADMTRRFWVATVFTLPLLAIAMSGMVPPLEHAIAALVPISGRPFIELTLALPVCFWAAWPFYERAIASVKHRSLNMFTLIGLGVSVSFVYSLVATLAPGLFAVEDAEKRDFSDYRRGVQGGLVRDARREREALSGARRGEHQVPVSRLARLDRAPGNGHE
jgi:Cu+-exporting ATPase